MGTNLLTSGKFKLYNKTTYYFYSTSIKCNIVSKASNNWNDVSIKIVPYPQAEVFMDNVSSEDTKHLTEIEQKELLSNFRGIITAYPTFQFSVKIDDKSIICDVIRIKGGYKDPYNFYKKFQVEFIKFSQDGDKTVVDTLNSTDLGIAFFVSLIGYSGQILGLKSKHSYIVGYLSAPSTLYDFVDGSVASYFSVGDEEVKGNVMEDSMVPSLNLVLGNRIGQLIYKKNLKTKTYKVRSHSSMEPWDDECINRRDRYVWANFVYDEKYIIQLILNLSKLGTFSFSPRNEAVVIFKEPQSKTELKKALGLHFFESVDSTSSRF